MTVPERSGLLLIKKSPGYTSFQALGVVKKAFSPAKVGHTGTLDKFAQGLLLALVGRAVKLAPWFSGCDKGYTGTIRFGVETDTLDGEGVSVAEAPPPSREALEAVLPRFRGDILQAPPAYSAVHVGGKRASVLARSGGTVDMQKRPVSVYALELLSYDPPLAHIRVRCSKGTYIRSLARDIALAAGSRAYLAALTRTHIAGFPLSAAVDPLAAADPAGLLSGALKPIDTAVFEALGLPWSLVDERTARDMIRGRPLPALIGGGKLRIPPGPSPALGLFRGPGDFVAVIRPKSPAGAAGDFPGWSYGYVYARP
jgi:tRNA pseudouridine55 synthase